MTTFTNPPQAAPAAVIYGKFYQRNRPPEKVKRRVETVDEVSGEKKVSYVVEEQSVTENVAAPIMGLLAKADGKHCWFVGLSSPVKVEKLPIEEMKRMQLLVTPPHRMRRKIERAARGYQQKLDKQTEKILSEV